MSDLENSVEDNDKGSGRADAFAALFAVMVVVAGMIYWVSQQ